MATTSEHAKAARAKFSSRNVSALYRAPARSVEPASSSPGGRMLVLKAPVRRANAVAAPTPINTPSLRKENNGQDAHVSLVPTGRSGWGASHESPRKEPQRAPVEPQAPQKQSENAWSDGRAAAAVLRRAPAVKQAVLKTENIASGRWGDDAVEEDLEKCDAQRQEETKREFPSLTEAAHDNQLAHDCAHNGYPQQCGFGGGRGVYAQDARVYGDGYSRPPSYDHGNRYEGLHADYEWSRVNGFGHGPHSDHHVRPPPFIEARGLHNHHSNQDVRFSSPTRFDRPPVHDRHYVDHRHHSDYHRDHYEQESRRFREHNDFHQGRLSREEYEYVRRMDDHCSRKESPAPEQHDIPVDNQSPQRNSTTTDPLSTTDRSSNPWRMSAAEREEASKPNALAQSIEPTLQRGSRQPSSTPEPSSVRILRRPGPRMLFDHKSGTMVHVDEITKDRRVRWTKRSTSEQEFSKASSIKQDSTADAKLDDILPGQNATTPTVEEDDKKSTSQSSVPDNKCLVRQPVDKVSTTTVPSKKLRVRPMQKASVSGRSVGRKMKAVVLKYRPVVEREGKEAAEVKGKSRRVKHESPVVVSSDDAVLSRGGTGSKKATEAGATTRRVIKKGDRQLTQRSRDQRIVRDVKDDCGAEDTANQDLARGRSTKSSSNIGTLKKLPIGTGVVVVEGSSTPYDGESGDDQFQTVKSRKTVMLEKRKQRELVRATLGGFHRRGDVKPSGARIVLSSSSVRIGRVAIEVKKTGQSESQSLAKEKRPLPPPLARSFIDVIRPPSPTKGCKLVNMQPEVDVPTASPNLATKRKKENASPNNRDSNKSRVSRMPRRVDPTSKKEYSGDFTKTKGESPARKDQPRDSNGDESRSPMESKHIARGRVLKRVYVAKQTDSAAPDKESSKAEVGTIAVANVSPSIQKRPSEAPHTKDTCEKLPTKTSSKPRSRRHSHRGSTDATIHSSAVRVPSVNAPKTTVTRYEPKLKDSSTQPPNPVEKESVPTPSRANRRPSKVKPVPSTKSVGLDASQKIYKKVYVVKATPTAAMASPSAA